MKSPDGKTHNPLHRFQKALYAMPHLALNRIYAFFQGHQSGVASFRVFQARPFPSFQANRADLQDINTGSAKKLFQVCHVRR